MKKGDSVKIISDLYGELGKTGIIVDLANSEHLGTLVEVKTDDSLNTYIINDVVKNTPLDIKDAINLEQHGFIEPTVVKVNKDAAYKRKTIMNEIIELWHTEINATDTAGLSEEHRVAYDRAFEAMNTVIEQELRVICDGR